MPSGGLKGSGFCAVTLQVGHYNWTGYQWSYCVHCKNLGTKLLAQPQMADQNEIKYVGSIYNVIGCALGICFEDNN